MRMSRYLEKKEITKKKGNRWHKVIHVLLPRYIHKHSHKTLPCNLRVRHAQVQRLHSYLFKYQNNQSVQLSYLAMMHRRRSKKWWSENCYKHRPSEWLKCTLCGKWLGKGCVPEGCWIKEARCCRKCLQIRILGNLLGRKRQNTPPMSLLISSTGCCTRENTNNIDVVKKRVALHRLPQKKEEAVNAVLIFADVIIWTSFEHHLNITWQLHHLNINKKI